MYGDLYDDKLYCALLVQDVDVTIALSDSDGEIASVWVSAQPNGQPIAKAITMDPFVIQAERGDILPMIDDMRA